MFEALRQRLDPLFVFESCDEYELRYRIPNMDETTRAWCGRVEWTYHLAINSEDEAFIEKRSRELGSDTVEAGTVDELIKWINAAREAD